MYTRAYKRTRARARAHSHSHTLTHPPTHTHTQHTHPLTRTHAQCTMGDQQARRYERLLLVIDKVLESATSEDKVRLNDPIESTQSARPKHTWTGYHAHQQTKTPAL